MSLRARLALVAAAVVAVVVLACSLAVFFAMRSELRGEVDRQLRTSSEFIQLRPGELRRFDNRFFDEQPRERFGAPPEYVQLVNAAGETSRPAGATVEVPVDERTLEVARGERRPFLSDHTISGVHTRVITARLAPGVALQLVRSLEEVDSQLSRLGLVLILVSLGGVLAAGIGGALVSRATLAPVRRVTEAAERVAHTRDPNERVPSGGGAELSRLASTFNAMLASLDDAIETQRRFVADASHELRTPLTSLRTNVDVLRRTKAIPEEQRERVYRDLDAEAQEMQGLVKGLLELARGRDQSVAAEPVRLDDVVELCADRARGRFREVTIDADLEPTTVRGVAERLERAVTNLIENACKWSPPGGTVTVRLRNGELTVADEGPGIDDADKPHVFERFYRAADARSLPGSGLGLAIVKDVAESHGGTATVEDAEGGGTLARLRLPQTEGSDPGGVRPL